MPSQWRARAALGYKRARAVLPESRVSLLTAAVLGEPRAPCRGAVARARRPRAARIHRHPVLTGLTQPTAVEFASDGRVFVAEKSGIIRVFSSISAPSSSVFADLRTQVHNFWDRGLLGLALHPNFPTDNRVYVLYTHDAVPGGTAPRWGDGCPIPPGGTDDGCLVTGRLSYLTASGNVSTGETVLITDWCQQFPSHSIGDLAFGPDGALYVSGGDGASFNYADYGQAGGSAGSPVPRNPCGDPPSGAGGTQTVPTAEGGALRSQDLRTARRPGDPERGDPAVEPRHRGRHDREPTHRPCRSECPEDRGEWPAKPIPDHDPPRNE